MGESWGSWTRNNRPDQRGHSSVPSWEKTFCTSVCNVPWDRICAAKVWMSNYKNVADWDDAGAMEAFLNAKARYWAESNGLPWETPLPDPDMYIDDVDHHATIDPGLIADLHKKPPPPPRSLNEHGDLSFEAFLSRTLPVKATGWGDDAEEGDRAESHPKPLAATGWADAADDQHKNCDDGVDQGGSSNGMNNQSWGQHWHNCNQEQRRRNGNRRRNAGHGSRFLKPTQQLNSHQQSSLMAGGYWNTTVHPGRPPMGQWLPKHRTLMNGQ